MSSLQKWLRIILPEVQLFDYVKQHGLITKKKRNGRMNSIPTSTTNSNTYASHKSTPSIHQRPSQQHSPISSSSVKDVARDAKKGVQQLRTNTNYDRLDEVFENIRLTLRQQVIEQDPFIEQLVAAYKKAFLQGEKGVVQQSILLAGPKGTGKMLGLSILVEQLYQHRLIPYRKIMEIDLSTYSDREIHTNFISDCAAAFEYGIGTVCFKGVDKTSQEILNYVSHLVSKGYFRTETGLTVEAKDYFIIFSVESDQSNKEDIVNILPMLIRSAIHSIAITRPLSGKSLEKITNRLFSHLNSRLINNAHFSITYSQEVIEYICRLAQNEKTFVTGLQGWIEDEIFSKLIELRALKIIKQDDKIDLAIQEKSIVATIGADDIPVLQLSNQNEEPLELLLKELNDLTGLQEVKLFVKELIDTVKVQKLRKETGQKDVSLTLHMIFSGNPGTGKTTVARLIGRILKAIGILSTGQLVETARQDLVGEYVGSTAPKTNAKIKEAIGGVLFIDEAYTLSRTKQDPFGQEAIDTLVKGMEDHRDNLVIILAGYTNEMGTFLKSNPGLPSRFPFQVEFPDYRPEEMLEICTILAKQRDYVIEEQAKLELISLFAKKQVPGRNDSGNGRLVRNTLEEAIRKQSVRLAEQTIDRDLNLLIKEDFGIVKEQPFQLEEKLSEIIGLDHIKTFLRTLEKQILVDRRRKEAGIKVKTQQNINMIFTGNPGTGKTTIARYVAEMLKNLGVIKQGHLVEVGRTELVSGYVGQTAEKTKDVVESALGGVLFIDEAYALVDSNSGGVGEEAINELVRLVEIHKGNLVVILAGYTEDMEKFLKVNPGLASRFPLNVDFPDYSAEEMVQMTEWMAQSRGFLLAESVTNPLKEWYETKQIAGRKDIGNGRLVRNTLEEAIRKQAVRISDEIELTNDELTLLIPYDFSLEEIEVEQTALEDLEKIIGLDEVKKFVESLFAQIEMNKRRKALGLPDMGNQSLHMVFKGNPGIGKTTIARVVAKRLKEISVIKSDTLVETDRAGLVAGYVGQTALKTKDVIDRALGGVLFIDEAYSLARDSFGKEAIDTLVKAMEDHKDELVVIVAGYEEDMEQFLAINPGLRSRFPNIITFPDYSATEMLKISRLVFHSKGYKASKPAEEELLEMFKEYEGREDSGNGRLVRNVCEEAIRQHAVRYAKKLDASVEELTTVDVEDMVKIKGGKNW
ncbi:AAA family ATPase [Alkalihalobacterium alkalinitrilicum]|uniref:AAA family ATPase n=1 Tax=Alkalihalobacterium alkalinitrilicum TaxID=427920 RepID=UPI001EE40E1D|nr:AAA family ATPase [Alkalihalobacterium alkalinitrilicum]